MYTLAQVNEALPDLKEHRVRGVRGDAAGGGLTARDGCRAVMPAAHRANMT